MRCRKLEIGYKKIHKQADFIQAKTNLDLRHFESIKQYMPALLKYKQI
jgi:hypothetical protein